MMASGLERPRLISGVCGDIAARAAVPVWLPRLAFLIFLYMHWLLAIVLYLVLARTVCARRPATRQYYAPPAPPPRPGFDAGARDAGFNDVRGRFGALDQRLTNLEAATLQQEAALRRAFRELERR
jgi:phage shock protein PspC (stress-responsive transcriptional regulator)